MLIIRIRLRLQEKHILGYLWVSPEVPVRCPSAGKLLVVHKLLCKERWLWLHNKQSHNSHSSAPVLCFAAAKARFLLSLSSCLLSPRARFLSNVTEPFFAPATANLSPAVLLDSPLPWVYPLALHQM